MIQEMINKGEIEFFKKEVPKPLTVFYQRGGQQAVKKTPHVPTPKLVVKVPAQFRYASDKAVPWN